MSDVRVVLLGGRSRSTPVMYHALASRFDVVGVAIEEPVDRATFLKRRARRLGAPTVLGQLAFRALVVPALEREAGARAAAVLDEHGLSSAPIPESVLTRVSSVNAAETVALIEQCAPDVVVINGTRIIARRVLDAIDAPVLNTHAGITPQYRGVHGGYWALVRNEPQRCGVSVHEVDPGIDTGGVIAQTLIEPDPTRDNFVTYPTLQLAAGIPLLLDAVERASRAELEHIDVPREGSKLWSHPTAWEYAFHRIVHGVR